MLDGMIADRIPSAVSSQKHVVTTSGAREASVSSAATSVAAGLTLSHAFTLAVEYQLKPVPESISIESTFFLSTRFGLFLDKRNCLDLVICLSTSLQLLLTVFAPIDPVAGTSQWTLAGVPRGVYIAAHIVVAICLTYLMLHRCNPTVLRKVILRARCAILFTCFILAHIVWSVSRAQHESSFHSFIEAGSLTLFRIPLMMLASATDSLFLTRRSRILISCVLCSCIIWAWLDTKCFSNSWCEQPNCLPFDPNGISIRELYLCLKGYQAVFILTGVLNLAVNSNGNFAYLCAMFVTSSTESGGRVVLFAMPSRLDVNHETLLNTHLGALLEQRGLLVKAIFASFFLSLVSLVVYSLSARNRYDEHANAVRAPSALTQVSNSCFIISIFVLLFCLMHRYNARLLWMSYRRFDVWFVAMSGTISTLLIQGYIVSSFGAEDLWWRCLQVPCEITIWFLAAGLDAIRLSRKVKLILFSFGVLHLSYAYLFVRFGPLWTMDSACVDTFAGAEMTITAREIFLGLLLCSCVLVLRAACTYLSGGYFSDWCPQFVPLKDGPSKLDSSSDKVHEKDILRESGDREKLDEARIATPNAAVCDVNAELVLPAVCDPCLLYTDECNLDVEPLEQPRTSKDCVFPSLSV